MMPSAHGCTRASRALPAFALLGVLLGACERPSAPPSYQGYVEADLVDIAPAAPGRLQSVAVRRGDTVAADGALYRLDDAVEQAAVAQAHSRIASAQARVDNLLGTRRTPEIEALRAQVASAQSAVDLTRTQLDQAERLYAASYVSKARLDEARALHARDRARLAEAQAHFANAVLAIGRTAEVKSAQAEVEAARAGLAQAQWQLEQRSARAPVPALVYETYYIQAEWVSAGAPIVSLLPPGHVKLRFFVPEADLGKLHPGLDIEARCNGCPAPIAARIDYISPRPEYTPPVIYSRDSRTKFVFLVEARADPKVGAHLNPGQPIDVRLAATPSAPAGK